MFLEVKILDSVIDKINLILKNKNIKYEQLNHKDGSTVNGFQTKNIIEFFDEKLLKEILFFNDFDKKTFWIHYIEYLKNGYQKKHNHKDSEKYSFILYLNDSDGSTVFEEPIKKSVKPTKGKLVLFSSDIIHYAEKSLNNKKILVGGIDKV